LPHKHEYVTENIIVKNIKNSSYLSISPVVCALSLRENIRSELSLALLTLNVLTLFSQAFNIS